MIRSIQVFVILFLLSCNPTESKSGNDVKPTQLNRSDMKIEKLPADFQYLQDMYDDDYFPNELVDKVKTAIQKVVAFIEEGGHSKAEIQDAFDKMTLKINGLQEEFENSGSELETGARESIGETIAKILEHYKIDIDVEEAIRERDWQSKISKLS